LFFEQRELRHLPTVNAAKKQTSKLAGWGFNGPEPFLIAGPCSAESEDQLLQTAKAIVASGRASALRAGVWKPRTRPGSFEGIGSPALKWLEKAKAETGLAVLTEVGNPNHVEQALKHNIDMLWIGARTTVNPFYVQEIAEALRGVHIPILIKNPLHPDIGLWMGAIERFSSVGISRLGAIHRGFYTDPPAPFRNEPRWELSFELRTRMPELPILCDPSHIAGRADLVGQVAQTALDINLDGLMIETHNNPSAALSDAAQQLTPDALDRLMDNLIIRSEEVDEEAIRQKLEALRTVIDGIDHDILLQLEKRFAQVDAIGKIKLEDDITVFQMARWFDMIADRTQFGKQLKLDSDLLHELFSVIHKYSVKRQTDIIHNTNEE
jgi:chorismate mutase